MAQDRNQWLPSVKEKKRNGYSIFITVEDFFWPDERLSASEEDACSVELLRKYDF